MKKSNKRLLIIIGLLFLVGLIVLGVVLGWFYNRGKRLTSRPLVLIHSPISNDQYQVGDGILVHATAREDQGLKRIELWVNDSLVDALDAEKPTPTNLVFASSWIPTYVGEHQIIVLAISADDIQGQSSLSVYTIEANEDGTGVHTVEEGETMESIAEDHGSSVEELSDLNPGLDPGDPSPGDDMIVPDDEPTSEEPPSPPEGDREAPFPAGDAPLMGTMFDVFGLFSPPAGQVTLRLELPGLRTWISYDGLHCYVSLAGSLPQWYPDQDNNQATDESFEALERGWWNTEDTLVGDNAPIINWPGDQPLPATISCVGVAGGGTEAVELGQIELEIPPEEWNGIRHPVEIDGEGGHLLIETRVTRLSEYSRAVPKWPDPDMTEPSNVRLNEENRTIEWDYEPRDDEEPIDGFRIYLNENLQWVEQEDARESRLPVEWFNPPCASTYTFGVTAYRIEGSDWPESYPGVFDLTQHREGCTRQIQVTFLSLETFHLGGDGRYEDRRGDVGPAYGVFYANRDSVSFDHGHEGSGTNGLSHNSTYNLAEVAGDRSWHFDGPNSVVTDVPLGGQLRVGFVIEDRDSGRCRYEGDRGCDDMICRGVHPPITEELFDFDAVHRSSITSDDGRCRVEFEFRPGPDSPVGTRGEGGEPLPWLQLIDFHVDEGTGETTVEMQNQGTAEWPGRRLTVELQTMDGHSLGHSVFEDVEIPVGEFETIRIPRTTPEPLFDVCVVLDSMDEVLELHERSGSMIHYPICPQVPDLIVEEAYYESHAGGRVRAIVRNRGIGEIDNRTLTVELKYPDGDLMIDPIFYSGISFAPGEIRTIEIPGLGDSVRDRMAGGYIVTINSDEAVLEESYENNSYTVEEGTRLSVYLSTIVVPYGARDIVEIHVDVYARTGRVRDRQVADWNITQDIDWSTYVEHADRVSSTFHDYEYYEPWFDIYGDEPLEVVVSFKHPGTRGGGGSFFDDYTVSEIFNPPTWGAGDVDPTTHNCHYYPARDYGSQALNFYNSTGRRWSVGFDFCRENFGEEEE
jgi:hypothetical protein